jgi:hypothetical protein
VVEDLFRRESAGEPECMALPGARPLARNQADQTAVDERTVPARSVLFRERNERAPRVPVVDAMIVTERPARRERLEPSVGRQAIDASRRRATQAPPPSIATGASRTTTSPGAAIDADKRKHADAADPDRE